MLDDIKIFITIVNNKSFNKAAKELKTHDITLKRRISYLEEKLGCTLFVKNKNRQELTSSGKNLYQIMKHDSSEIEEKLKKLDSLQKQIAGNIFVVFPPFIALKWIIPHLYEFVRKYPELRINLLHSNMDISNINIDFDIALSMIKPVKNSLLIKKFLSLEMILCASPQYLKVNGKINNFKQLQKHKLAVVNQSDSNHKNNKISGNNIVTAKRIEVDLPEPYLISDSYAELFEMIVNSTSIGGLPLFLVKEAIDNGDLVNIFPEYKFDYITLYLIRNDIDKNRNVAIFEEFLYACRDKAIDI